MPNAQDQFLDSLKGDDTKLVDDQQFLDIVDKPADAVPPKAPTPPQEDDSPRNRRERRLMEKLKQERETTIALNERIKVLAELDKRADSTTSSVDPDLVKLFGDTAEGKLAQEIISRKFSETEERAYKRAIAELDNQRDLESTAESQNSSQIDEGFASVEDKYNVDLSGDTKESAATRNGFIDFLEEISPKDKNGEIIEYADFESAFDVYRRMNEKGKPREVSERQKSLANRSMENGGTPAPRQAPKGPINFNVARRYIDSLYEQQQKGNL